MMALTDLFGSQGYKTFTRKMLWLSVAVCVAGLVLLIAKRGSAVFLLGSVALAAVLVLKVIETIVKHNN